MELMTNRLILREFEASDFSAVHEYASGLDNVKYMIWGSNDESDGGYFRCPLLFHMLPSTYAEANKLSVQ
ncbi:MAG: hypothetical protein GX383_06175 [Clostridium sp.]|jgi:RimJ/RimL family protein N-acetyltransferase|nr:hypothetical protein [Clostridium sp.]